MEKDNKHWSALTVTPLCFIVSSLLQLQAG